MLPPNDKCYPVLNHAMIWATPRPASHESRRQPADNIAVQPADTISAPECRPWPCRMASDRHGTGI